MPNIAERQNGVPTDSAGLRHHGKNHVRHSLEFGIVPEGVPPQVWDVYFLPRRREMLLTKGIGMVRAPGVDIAEQPSIHATLSGSPCLQLLDQNFV